MTVQVAYGPEAAPGRVAIGIPTAGRASILVDTVRAIATQTRLPDLVLVCVAEPRDATGLDRLDLPCTFRVKGLVQFTDFIDTQNWLEAEDRIPDGEEWGRLLGD